jgi:hypothetical protein
MSKRRRNQWSSENEDVTERRLNAAARQWAEDLAEIADALEWASDASMSVKSRLAVRVRGGGRGCARGIA